MLLIIKDFLVRVDPPHLLSQFLLHKGYFGNSGSWALSHLLLMIKMGTWHLALGSKMISALLCLRKPKGN
jgi:hypothetical protein